MINLYRGMFLRSVAIGMFFLLVRTLLCSQGIAQTRQPENLVILEHADSLVGMDLNGEKVRQLTGHVRFRQGNTTIACDRATQYLVSNKILLEGTVEVHDDSLRLVGARGMYYSDTKIAEAFERVLCVDPTTTLRSQYGKYYSNERKAYFRGNVYVEDTSSVLTSDELEYFRTDQHSIAAGNVKITNVKNGLTIYGERFESYKQKGYSKMTGEPRLVQVDTAGTGKHDTLEVMSRVMESFQDTLERLVATDSVSIVRGGLFAQAAESVLYTKLDSIILRHSPVIWYTQQERGDNQVSGDSVFLKLKNRKLHTAYVEGRAIAISRADSTLRNRFNQLTGQEIILHFDGDKIHQIDVNTTATSLYYLFDQGKPNGLNKTTGDHITMTFLDGKIDRISAITGVEGQYYPERLVKERESIYNLDGFNYREFKMVKR